MPVELSGGGNPSTSASASAHHHNPHHHHHHHHHHPASSSAASSSASISSTSSSSSSPAHSLFSRHGNRLWARVSWMPHASLSQTSHVAVAIRAAFCKREAGGVSGSSGGGSNCDNRNRNHQSGNPRSGTASDDSWQVRATVRGMGGLELVPVGSATRSAPLVPLCSEDYSFSASEQQRCKHPSVAGVTHVCRWDGPSNLNGNLNGSGNGNLNGSGNGSGNPLQIPLRWRDLPRDAYLELTVTQGARSSSSSSSSSPLSLRSPSDFNERYEPATLSFFDDYGKLRTGLNKIPLRLCRDRNRNRNRNRRRRGRQRPADNPGLFFSAKQNSSSSNSSSSNYRDDDDDPVWKASKMLEQLDRFDEQHASNNIAGTGGAHKGGTGTMETTSNNTTNNTNSSTTTNNNNSSSNAGSHHHTGHHNFGDIPSVPWLDRMAREYCERTLREAKDESRRLVVWPGCEEKDDTEEEEEEVEVDGNNDGDNDDDDSDRSPPSAFLVVEFPAFDVPVVHEETFYPTPHQGPSGSVTPLDIALYHQREQKQNRQRLQSQSQSPSELQLQLQSRQQQLSESALGSAFEPPAFHPLSAVPFLDYENDNDSPIDDKYRTLAHDLLRGLVDPALKPDRTQRDKLAAIIASPSHHPTREEQDLLWRFRFSLVDNRKALTKFLLAVDWTVETEVVQAAELLEQWRKRSPIEVTDALKLLGKQVAYQTNLVRAYAIDTLAAAPDEELNLYLLQLVQALKFENSLQQQQQQQQQDEDADADTSAAAAAAPTKRKSSLATFLIARSSRNVLLANYLYWYLKVELQDPAHGARYREIFDELEAALRKTPYPRALTHPPGSQGAGSTAFSSSSSSSSSSLSLKRSSSSSSSSSAKASASQSAPAKSAASLVNKLGVSVSKLGDKLLKAADSASASAATDFGSEHGRGPGSSEGAFSKNRDPNTDPKKKRVLPRSVWDVLTDQDGFISGVMDVQMSYLSKARQPAKEAHLRSVLEEEGYAPPPKKGVRGNFPMPCAPHIMVNGVFPQKAKVFKSAVYPALIEFNVEYVVDKTAFVGGTSQGPSSSSSAAAAAAAKQSRRGSGDPSAGAGAKPPKKPPSSSVAVPPQIKSYRVLMKTGDDLRQDQLVMMMIKLMDRLLKRASLDLCITPYSIIATSPSSGMIEFVEESVPLSAILANHNNSILRFFRSVAPQPGTKYGVKPEVISSYVRSVAGGCVLTYLMGVGDRHLDNLMITKTGRFFHIDFGFLFGRDPKPLPPAFRLTREMVEGMGGSESAEYRQFCSLACQAFNALRKSAGLVLNLLHLMSDAGIEDLSNNPSADADGVIAKVEERFKLDLTDEQAERFFLTLISDSLSALAPRLMDVFHSIAVARR